MICKSCNKTILYHVQGICPKCGDKVAGKPQKKKIGRPRTKTPAQRNETDAQRHTNNAERRNKYQRDRARKKNGVRLGKYIVECDGRWKRCPGSWGTFSLAKVYTSKSRAKLSCKYSHGSCRVMLQKETEKETIGYWNAEHIVLGGKILKKTA